MDRFKILVFLACSLSFASFARADDLDAASIEALAKTQQLMQTPDLRDKEIKTNPNAAIVDAQVSSLTGNGANKESLYRLSSGIFEDMVKSTHGDAAEMQSLILKAKDDPQGFYDSLSEENKKAIRDLSGKVYDSPTTTQRAPASN
jgi:hypothetical protein